MKKRKVPKELYKMAKKVEQNLLFYETVDRYVINCILEAGRVNVPLDEVFIKAAYKALKKRPVPRLSENAA